MRPSQAEHDQLPGATTASRMTIPPPSTHAIQTGPFLVFPDPVMWPTRPTGSGQLNPDYNQHIKICHQFNEGRCRSARCRYHHSCSWCGGNHTLVTCPKQAHPTRSRSPFLPPGQGPPASMANRMPPRS